MTEKKTDMEESLSERYKAIGKSEWFINAYHNMSMTDKEVKEESLLPSVESIVRSSDIQFRESFDFKNAIEMIKEYGELVKWLTVVEMKNAIVNSDTYQVDDSFVIYVDVACNAMDIAENSPELKIH